MHINLKLLEAVARGELPPRVLYEIARDHIAAICPTCREAIEAHEAAVAVEREVGPHAYERHFEAVKRKLGLSKRQAAEEEGVAREWIEELLSISAKERRGKVKRAYKRFRGSVFGELLIDVARKALPEDPRETISLADAAYVSCYETNRESPNAEVLVQAMAVRGNAYRVIGDFKQADADLRFARRLINQEAVTDTLICAEVDSYEGSLRKEERRLDEAAVVLHRAQVLYRLVGDTERRARVMIQLGLVHYQKNEIEEGLSATREALNLLDRERHERLVICGLYNLALLLHAAGECDPAEKILHEDSELFGRAETAIRHRVVWLEGKIAWSRGDFELAEERFRLTYRNFTARGLGFDVALVALHLSLVHLAKGETEEVKRLSAEALRLFAEREVHPEALAALKILEEAARRENVTRQLIEQTASYLERAQAKPRKLPEPS